MKKTAPSSKPSSQQQQQQQQQPQQQAKSANDSDKGKTKESSSSVKKRKQPSSQASDDSDQSSNDFHDIEPVIIQHKKQRHSTHHSKIPDKLNVSRKGDRHMIDTPKTYSELKKQVSSLNLLKQKAPLRFSDLANNEITNDEQYQVFLTTNNSIIILYTDGEDPLENPEEMMVDITPSKNILLKAGTSDYTTSNALAEFIDNSIQAVRGNPMGKKIIKIEIKEPVNGTTSIRFYDNGCGMTKNDLHRWGTMGMSQADVDGHDHTASGATITGMISRFGVGAKKAAFYLGTKVQVITKVSGSLFTNEATISLDILNSTHDQDWKIPIKVRQATKKELDLDHFTEVHVFGVSLAKLQSTSQSNFVQSISSIKRDLAHIYFYYLHPLDLSHVSLDEDDEEFEMHSSAEEDVESPTETDAQQKQSQQPVQSVSQPLDQSQQTAEQPEQPAHRSKKKSAPHTNDYKISLNHFDLASVDDSMEDLYLEFGKRLKQFSLRVENIDVVCKLRYFPYIAERETLPIPYRILNEHPTEPADTFPLSLRKPGLEVFWNGRLIPDAHIERLAFMTGGKVDKEKLDEKWIQRVKGAIYLTSDFPVNQNKTNIIKEHAIFQSLDKSGTRANTKDWKSWLLRCHKSYDQDFQFEVELYDTESNKTFCKTVSVGGFTFQKGDAVKLGIRKLSCALIKEMHFVGTPDSRTSEFLFTVDRVNYKPLPLETVPGSKIYGKIAKEEYTKLLEEQRNLLPKNLKIYEGDRVPYPKKEYKSGEKISYLSAMLYDRNTPPRPVTKAIIEAESIKITLQVIYMPNNEVVYTASSAGGDQFYKTGAVSYTMGGVNLFQKTGAYIFKFTCSFPNVKEATHYCAAIHGDPTDITGVYQLEKLMTNAAVPLDADLPPILLSVLDAQGNNVPVSLTPKDKIVLTAVVYSESEPEQRKEAKLSKNPAITSDDRGIEIKGLQVIDASLDDDSVCVIRAKWGDMTCELEPIRIIAGTPTQMSFPDDPFEQEVMNLMTMKGFEIYLKDRCGNIYNPSILTYSNTTQASQQKTAAQKKTRRGAAPKPQELHEYIMASSTSLEEDHIKVAANQDGGFIFADTSALQIHQRDTPMDIDTPNAKGKTKAAAFSLVPVQFSFYKGEKELVTVEKKVKVTPSFKPASLRLNIMDGTVVTLGEDTFKVLSGASINFGVKVYSAGGGGKSPFELSGLKAKVSVSWDPKATKEIAMDSLNMLVLPPLMSDKSTRKTGYWVNITVPWNLAQNKSEKEVVLKKEFSLETTGGAPSTFFAQPSKGTVLNKVRCDSEVTIEVRLHDKRGNIVSPEESRSDMQIEPVFELTSEDPSAKCYISNSKISPFNNEKNLYLCHLTIVGFGPVTLTVKDKNNTITEYPLKLIMIEGSASQVRVNNLSKLSVSCARGDYLEEIKVSLCDSLGNVTTTNGIEIQCEWVGLTGAPPFAIKNKAVVKNGHASIKNMDIVGAEGTYEMRVTAKNMNLTEATVIFIIKGSASIRLYNPTPIMSKPLLTIPPIKISVLNAEGMALKVMESTVKAVLHMKSFDCTGTENDGSVYLFEDIKAPRKANTYTLKFIYSTGGANKVELDETLVVVPDDPVKLDASTNIAPHTSSQLAHDLRLFVTDQHDNRVIVTGEVRPSIELAEQLSQSSYFQMPSLMQPEAKKFNAEGEAVFPLLSLKESVGLSQVYNLTFKTNHTPPMILSRQFVYRNSKEDLDKKVELEAKRLSINKDLGEVQTVIETLSQNIFNLNNKKSQYKKQIDEVQDQLKKDDPNFDSQRANQRDDVIKTINEIQGVLDKMSGSNRRRASTPNNSIARELSDKAKSVGLEKSGILGLVMELIYIESNEEAQLVGRMIGKKMETVLVQSSKDLDQYFNMYKNHNNPIYFVALDLINPFVEHNRDQRQDSSQSQSGLLPLYPMSGAPTNGFLGYLVNRLQFKAQYEKLRRTIGWMLFKDAMVFESLVDGYNYRNFCVKAKRPCPTILCLKEIELIEASGMVLIGKKDVGRDQHHLGQLPITESAEFNKLVHLKSLWDNLRRTHHQFYNFRKEIQKEVEDTQQVMSVNEQKKAQLLQQQQQVSEQLKKIEKESKSSGSQQQ
ncbi:hypothetical protein SAMD00019534_095730 [Acytostelium subglobosum LB1]|uniref:hypothetical protein n=1 Tax=Acytostelium subglobosum LB1 TaxID=1410327 RepID=UPI000644CAED|nr:hypothetical protein SAMD00019534_095730 [Acytostelium subglobosum LB1]GAM26398.1 hypothetical protein SAMD00019534_095730 [Acytostelium subglobosum LB1]|eukprot:XP_012750494.1 hypothetical protein SAMD00019534_095730 [Acytostelium subglobosum LB1]